MFAEEAGLDVVGDAYDFEGEAAAGDGLADGILVGEIGVGKNLIDDGDAGRGGGFVGEVTALDEVDAEGVQIAGSSHVEFNAGSGVERLFAKGLETVAAMAAREGKRIGNRGRSDA